MTREEARNVIEKRFEILDYCESKALEQALDVAIEALEEPKKGEWLSTTHSEKCSSCGHEIEPRLFGAYMRYCCVCGSYNKLGGDT